MGKRSICNSSEFRNVVQKAIDSGKWIFEGTGGKHKHLRHKDSGKLVVYPVASSCPRAAKNFVRDMRHVEAGLPGFGMPNVIVGITLPKKAKGKHAYA